MDYYIIPVVYRGEIHWVPPSVAVRTIRQKGLRRLAYHRVLLPPRLAAAVDGVGAALRVLLTRGLYSLRSLLLLPVRLTRGAYAWRFSLTVGGTYALLNLPWFGFESAALVWNAATGLVRYSLDTLLSLNDLVQYSIVTAYQLQVQLFPSEITQFQSTGYLYRLLWGEIQTQGTRYCQNTMFGQTCTDDWFWRRLGM